MKKVILLLLTFFAVTFTAQAESLEQIREVLKHVETKHNPDAVGDFNDEGIPQSYGILQIQEGAIKDVNKRYGTNYKHYDAFTVECAEEIFDLYVTMWSEHLELKENRKATPEDIVRIWNGGPRGYKRASTKLYLVKYRKNRYLCEKDDDKKENDEALS